mmetsp:Transcript_4866/g.13553  ORF Transcript_4866/g.13553 Transcript_4866/m.13553 type:complete len:371 (+) Transcript_4866:551-1663(+)
MDEACADRARDHIGLQLPTVAPPVDAQRTWRPCGSLALLRQLGLARGPGAIVNLVHVDADFPHEGLGALSPEAHFGGGAVERARIEELFNVVPIFARVLDHVTGHADLLHVVPCDLVQLVDAQLANVLLQDHLACDGPGAVRVLGAELGGDIGTKVVEVLSLRVHAEHVVVRPELDRVVELSAVFRERLQKGHAFPRGRAHPQVDNHHVVCGHIPGQLDDDLGVDEFRGRDEVLALLLGYQDGRDVDGAAVPVVGHDDPPNVLRAQVGVLFVDDDHGVRALLLGDADLCHERALATAHEDDVDELGLAAFMLDDALLIRLWDSIVISRAMGLIFWLPVYQTPQQALAVEGSAESGGGTVDPTLAAAERLH